MQIVREVVIITLNAFWTLASIITKNMIWDFSESIYKIKQVISWLIVLYDP